MARYGIKGRDLYGVPGPRLKAIARELGSNHPLALELRRTGVFEARTLAALVADPRQLTPREMDRWVNEFENWADCDSTCLKLFVKVPWAFQKATAWSRRKPEVVRRAGLAMMAALAVHAKGAPDEPFLGFLRRVEQTATDDRNLVKKGANWALRQIGKRNLRLHGAAVAAARRIGKIDSPSARWIASDALRELQAPAVRRRLAKRG